MASLQEFISRIKENGTAKSNRFLVTINNPAVSEADIGKLTSLYCEQASLPGMTIASQANRTFGEQREIVYDRTFDTINLNFILDKEFKVKSYFDLWMDKIINPKSRLVGYYNNYATTISIKALNTQDSMMYETTLYEAYPKTIGAITLDSNSKDIARLQVTFAYKYHVNMSPNSVNVKNQNDISQKNAVLSQLERQGAQIGRGLATNSPYTE